MPAEGESLPQEDDRGEILHGLIRKLFPICRSITGNGVRESLRLLQEVVPLKINAVPTGTQVFDWEVPKEWNIREAWIRDSRGEKVVDLRDSSLHVLNYSVPVHRKMPLAELKKHIHTLEKHPDWVPYRTSYYQENWGFCMAHRTLERLEEGEFEAFIDSTLEPGHLTYGEYVVPGTSDEEILISAHCCHPSLANDNLSGMVVAAELARALVPGKRRYTCRFVWVPGTIGSITWLATNEPNLGRVKHGLVLSCLGDRGGFTYKRSRRADAEIDQVIERVLKDSGRPFQIEEFTPIGYDERQYCSPGINLPVGCLMRTPNGRFPEYHTSADNLDFVHADALRESLSLAQNALDLLEGNRTYRNLFPKGEPQLGRRGLYRKVGGTENNALEAAILWLLNFSDSQHSILDISRRANLPAALLLRAAELLLEAGLISPIESKN